MEEPDLSSTVWTKTLTAKQRKALRQPYGKTPAEWLAIVKEMRGRGLLVLPPPESVKKQLGRLVLVADIISWLEDKATQEGFTFFARLGDGDKPIPPTKGFAVAMGRTVLKKRKSRLLARLFGDKRRALGLLLSQWLAWGADLEQLWGEIGVCVGGWFDPDTGVFEVSLTLVFNSQEEAERFGLRQDQKAIFRLPEGEGDEGEIINIGGSGKPRWVRRKWKTVRSRRPTFCYGEQQATSEESAR